MKHVELKFNRDGHEFSISSDDARNIIIEKLKNIYSNDDNYLIYESGHNFVINHTEYNEVSETGSVLRVVFDDNNKVLAIYIYDIYDTGLIETKSSDFNSKICDLENKLLSMENHRILASCPFREDWLPKDVLNKDSDTKLCNDEIEINCYNCNRRSRMFISAKIENDGYIIEINPEWYNSFSIVDENIIDIVNGYYGYHIDIHSGTITDVNPIITEETNE